MLRTGQDILLGLQRISWRLRLRCRSLTMLAALHRRARGALPRLPENCFVTDDNILASSKKIFFFARLIVCSSMFVLGCSRAPKPITGAIFLGNPALETIASQPNAVCYLIAKDQWGISVITKRWLNPKFPIDFSLTPQDLLLPMRPWEGPFFIEAALFVSLDPAKELPPPPIAKRVQSGDPVNPGAPSLRLVFN